MYFFSSHSKFHHPFYGQIPHITTTLPDQNFWPSPADFFLKCFTPPPYCLKPSILDVWQVSGFTSELYTAISEVDVTVILWRFLSIYQHISRGEIDKKHNEVFKNLYDGLSDNELSTHFGEDKTKSIFCM